MKNLHCHFSLSSLSLSLLILLTSCEHVSFSDFLAPDGKTLVTLHITPFQQQPFPSRSTLSEAANRLDIAIFNSDGTRATKVNQKSTDADYGNPSFYLTPGTYTITCIAHNGSGIATMTTLEEVTFPSNKTTDTFLNSQTLVIGDSPVSTDITLHRCVSMVRFIVTDTDIPSEVSQLKFYYTGGSSTLNPITGFGSKQSKQTEYRLLSEAPRDDQGHPIFEIYTFPHENEDLLKITVTPQTDTSNDLTQYEHIFTDVPVTLNTISTHQGSLFNAGSSTSSNVTIAIDTNWTTITHEF